MANQPEGNDKDRNGWVWSVRDSTVTYRNMGFMVSPSFNLTGSGMSIGCLKVA